MNKIINKKVEIIKGVYIGKIGTIENINEKYIFVEISESAICGPIILFRVETKEEYLKIIMEDKTD